MRFITPVVLLVILATVGISGYGRSAAALLQEATPCALWPPRAPDITTWEIGQFSQWPSTTLVQLEPGAQVDGYDGIYKSKVIELIFVQTSALTLESETPMAVNRGEDGSVEVMAPETEFTVKAGDYFVVGPITPTISNDGSEPASYQSAMIYPSDPIITDPCAPLG